MWLMLGIKSYLGWALSIGRRMVAIAAPQVAIVVLATIISQLAKVIAFLLPLKIILLIGSPGVPRYFPAAFQSMDRESLVIGLGLSALGFYVTYMIAEKTVAHFTERSAERVLADAAKLALFPQQAEMVGSACRRLAESIAAVIFASLAITLLAFVFPAIATIIVSWLVGALLVAALLSSWSAGFRTWLEANAYKAVEIVSTTGFFIVTASIIGLFLAGTEFTVLLAIIAVLLSRQLLQRLGTVFTNALGLYPRRALINSLFLRGHSWSSNAMGPKNSVWDLVSQPEHKWLPQLLEDITGEEVRSARITKWLETGAFDVPTFEATTEGETPACYLVKVFERRQSLGAMQETALLGSMAAGQAPAPEFLGSSEVGEAGHPYLLYRMPNGRQPSPIEFARAKRDLVVDCWKCSLPTDLVHRFRRTHQLLGQRLAGIALDRMMLVAQGQQEETDIGRFRDMLPVLCSTLAEMPLVIIVPDLRAETVFRIEDDRHVIISWGRWRLEPVGAGWAFDEDSLADLPAWLAKAGAARRDLAKVEPEKAQLAALLYELERLLTLQRYRAALEFLPTILAQAESVTLDGRLHIRHAS